MERDVPEEELPSLTFEKGVNNIDGEDSLPEGSARSAINVDIPRTGYPRTRKGYTRKAELVNGHSLHSHKNVNLVVSDNKLSTFNTDDFILYPIFESSYNIQYSDIVDVIYFTNGEDIGRIDQSGQYNKVWVDNPYGNPTVEYSPAGGLQAGKYLVSITNIDRYGEESGTDISVPIELSSNGGIKLTNIPQNIDVHAVRIYLTSTGGEVFYRQIDLPMGLTSHIITDFSIGKQLETQFASPMPAGSALCNHYGRLYVAVDDYVFYSEALRFGLTRITDNYFPIVGGKIKMIMSHTTGLYIIADKTYFLNGTNPEDMTLKMVYPHSGVSGTGNYVRSTVLGIEYPGDIPVWFSDNGLVYGSSDGAIIPVTEKTLSVDKYGSGASLYREEEGLRSIITSLREKEETQKLATSDSVSFEIRRNGIII